MNNIYKEYFETLKKYLIILETDKNKIIGCNDKSIGILSQKYGKLPLAYEEFMRSIGGRILFEFMDAEDMSYENLDELDNFYNEVFENNINEISKNYIPVSERYRDYITLISKNEENPKVWTTENCYGIKKGEKLKIVHNSFIEMINIFFKHYLNNNLYNYYFVPSKIKNSEKYIKKKVSAYMKSLNQIKIIIGINDKKNILVKELNIIILEYISKNNSMSEGKSEEEENYKNVAEENTLKDKRHTFFQKILILFYKNKYSKSFKNDEFNI